jgi:hypothetical protein
MEHPQQASETPLTIGYICAAYSIQIVAMSSGRIASTKPDDRGRLTLLPDDVDFPPGNSGGPIVEARSGRLLGVAVAGSPREDVRSNVGLLVPADEVRRRMPMEWTRAN